jgi:hypothetical protein
MWPQKTTDHLGEKLLFIVHAVRHIGFVEGAVEASVAYTFSTSSP